MMITSYKELPYKKYMEIQDTILYFDNDSDRTTQIISVLNDLEFDDVENLTLTDYNRLAKQAEFLKYEITTEVKDIYPKLTINNREYTLFTDIENMTVAQYIDFSNYLKDAENKVPEMLSCFIIPKDAEQYNKDYDIQEVINDINEYLDVYTVKQLSNFFFLLSQSLTKGFLKSKIGTMKKMARKEKNKALRKTMMERVKAIEKDYHHIIGSL